jgi:hypothetical protein
MTSKACVIYRKSIISNQLCREPYRENTPKKTGKSFVSIKTCGARRHAQAHIHREGREDASNSKDIIRVIFT